MIGRVLGALLVLAATVAPSSASANHDPFYSYADLQAFVTEWEALGARIHVPARTEAGRNLYLVEVGSGPFTILYVNVLHANEPSGSDAFIRFVSALLGDLDPTFDKEVLPGITPEAPVITALADPIVRSELLSRVTIVGFPMMDPDGFANEHARDFMANTDYSTKVTEQSAALDWALERFEPDLLLDSHGGPDRPELNIGLVEPLGTPDAVVAQSRHAAEVAWRSGTAVGAEVAYFEEHFFEIVLGETSEPFASADEVYWMSASRLLPFSQESYQLEGLPAVYTETVGLQSVDPVISISEGASVQQVSMIALALEAAGLLSGERPGKTVVEPAETSIVSLPEGARSFSAAVRWKLPGQDYRLALMDGSGIVAESAGGPLAAGARSRAISTGELAPGSYSLVVVPVVAGIDDDSTVRAVWRVGDSESFDLGPVLDSDADVAFCLNGSSLGDVMRATPQTAKLATPRCE